MNGPFRGGMQVHAVPDEERAYDAATGVKLPWGYSYAEYVCLHSFDEDWIMLEGLECLITLSPVPLSTSLHHGSLWNVAPLASQQ